MTKECPSCAMDVDGEAKVCPICGYEFAGYSQPTRWVAWTLLLLVVMYLIYTFIL